MSKQVEPKTILISEKSDEREKQRSPDHHTRSRERERGSSVRGGCRSLSRHSRCRR
ncbi:hypothetical protein Hanom_Chr01g00028711 [Helianthus anomalus]